MQEVQAAGNRGIPPVETPSRLAVATTPDNARETVLRMLAEAGFTRAGESNPNRLPQLVDATTLSDLDSIRDWLAENADAHLLLLFNSPMTVIARSVANGVAPSEALEHWRNHVENLLALVRRYRRRLTLLPLERALVSSASLTKVIGERFGLSLKPPDATSPGIEAPRAIFRMMAQNTLWQSVDARNLAAELEANALPMPPADDQMFAAVEEVYREFNEALESARAQQSKPSDDEIQQLRTQLGEKEQELQALRDDKTQTKDLEEENELLLLQLHQVQEELESYFLNGVGTSDELEEARATIDAMCNSKSWKITWPLRWFLEKFMGAEKAVR